MSAALDISGAFSLLTPTDAVGLTRLGGAASVWPGLEALRVEVTLHKDSVGNLSVVLRESQLIESRGLDEVGRPPRRWDSGSSVVARATRTTLTLALTESGAWFGKATCGASPPYAAFEWTVKYHPTTGKTDITLWTLEDENQRHPARQRGRATSVRLPQLR